MIKAHSLFNFSIFIKKLKKIMHNNHFVLLSINIMYYSMDDSQSKTTTVELHSVPYFEELQPKTSVDLDIARSSQVAQPTTKYVTTSGEDESACWICGGFTKTKELVILWMLWIMHH